MSFDEKSTWIMAVLAAVVPGAYLVAVLGQARNVAVLGQARNMPVAEIASPKEDDKRDERDTSQSVRRKVGSDVLYVGVLVALGLAMARLEYFWIANAIYVAFVLSGLTSSAVKIVAYRRGF